MSWWLAENSANKVGVSYIELDKPVSEASLVTVQERCNEVIRTALPVNVANYNVGDPELDKVHMLMLNTPGPIYIKGCGYINTSLLLTLFKVQLYPSSQPILLWIHFLRPTPGAFLRTIQDL